MKKIAIIQSNYIPWKGYFDIINMVDEFVILDDVQYTIRDWRNRNKIKTANGVQWLTIPVQLKSFWQKIKETRIADNNWNIKHWKSICYNYTKARFFRDYKNFFEELYLTCNEEYLSEINFKFILSINSLLDIKTKIRWSNEFHLVPGKNERLIEICKQTGANIYLTGPSAKAYLDEELFNQEGIQVEWMDYSGYEEYNQLYPPFEHGVSIIDLILNEGPNSKKFMKSFRNNTQWLT